MATLTPGRNSKGLAFTLLGVLLFLFTFVVYNKNEITYFNSASRIQMVPTPSYINYSDPLHCMPGVPCEYENEVDIRIVVLTQKRTQSLMKTLASLENMDTDGDTAVLEIWFDRLKDGSVNLETLDAATGFKWNKGKKRVHIQQKNVGIAGQWIDTWRPKNNTKELCLILEDDIDVSPYFYKFLKAAHKSFGDLKFIQGYSLQDEGVLSGSRFLGPNSFPNEQVFMNPIIGTWGYAPHPLNWRLFQDWYHVKRKEESFKLYVPQATQVNSWYSTFVQRGTQDNMWEMWTIYYASKHQLWSVFNNIRSYVGKNKGLSWNRQEAGLHYGGNNKGRASDDKLLQEWDESYTKWPPQIRMLKYDGSLYQFYEKNRTVI